MGSFLLEVDYYESKSSRIPFANRYLLCLQCTIMWHLSVSRCFSISWTEQKVTASVRGISNGPRNSVIEFALGRRKTQLYLASHSLLGVFRVAPVVGSLRAKTSVLQQLKPPREGLRAARVG